jgi:hypothetical protein
MYTRLYLVEPFMELLTPSLRLADSLIIAGESVEMGVRAGEVFD